MKTNLLPNSFQVTYENGMLKPLIPLNLEKGYTIRLQIISDSIDNKIIKTFQALKENKVIIPPKGETDIQPVSDEERIELSKKIGKAANNKLSEIIIEDRGIF